jgi:hypothetical protein
MDTRTREHLDGRVTYVSPGATVVMGIAIEGLVGVY